MNETTMEALVGEFRKRPFPPAAAEDDTLGELHAEVAGYDAHMAGLLDRLVHGEGVAASDLVPDRELEAAIASRAESTNSEDAIAGRELLDYVRRLNSLVQIAADRAAA